MGAVDEAALAAVRLRPPVPVPGPLGEVSKDAVEGAAAPVVAGAAMAAAAVVLVVPAVEALAADPRRSSLPARQRGLISVSPT